MAAAGRFLFDAGVLGPMRHAPGRVLLAVLAIALGVALGLAIYLINRVAADEVSLAARSLFGIADLAVEAAGDGFDESLYPAVARLEGVAVASPVVQIEAGLAGRRGALTLLGVDAYRSQQLQPAFARLGTPIWRGQSVTPQSDAVLLSAAAARSLELAAGDELEVQVGMQREKFAVAAVLPDAALHEHAAVMDIATAQWKFARLGRLSRLNLRLEPGVSAQRMRESLANMLPVNARVIEPGDATDEALRLSRAYRSNLTALALVALFTGGFFVYSTQSLAVLGRRREFALLHALGVTRTEQLLLMLSSGAVVGLLGAVVGILLGGVIAKLAMAVLGGDLGSGLFAGVEPVLQVRVWEAVAFCVLGAAVAVLGTVRPALEAAQISTAAALKAGDVTSHQLHTRGWLIVVLFVMAAIVLRMPAISGLPLPGYVSIALLIFGTVAAMPAALQVLLGLFVRHDGTPRRQGVPGEIAIAHLRGTARYAALSVSAIVVSFSLMIAMVIMVNSFRHSLDLWTQRILPADLYLRAGYAGDSSYLEEDIVQSLRAVAGVGKLEMSRMVEAELRRMNASAAAKPHTVTLIARDIDPQHADRSLWIRSEAVNPVPQGAISVWVSEGVGDLLGVRAGDGVDVLIAGKPVRASVRGLWRDYQHQMGAVIMQRSTYLKLTGDRAVNAAWLWVEADASLDAIQQQVRDRLPADAQFDMRTPADIRRLSLLAFDRTFAITYALELIAILIGLFGISAGTSAQVLARRGEFGVLRHIGLTRAQIAATLAIEGAGLGALGVLAGLLTGAVVSLILIYVVNRQSFHWSMDVFLPGGLVGALAVALVGSSALIAVFSGRQAMRGDVVRAVKEDW